MPTLDEGQEIIDNTSHSWTPVGSTIGMTVVSVVNASLYLFLPAAGFLYNGQLKARDEQGCWWESDIEHYPGVRSASAIGATETDFWAAGSGNPSVARSVRGVIP